MEKQQWRRIETAPNDGTTIIGWWVNGEQHTGSICDGKWIPAWEESEKWDMPFFWMPLADEPPRDAIQAELAKRTSATG